MSDFRGNAVRIIHRAIVPGIVPLRDLAEWRRAAGTRPGHAHAAYGSLSRGVGIAGGIRRQRVGKVLCPRLDNPAESDRFMFPYACEHEQAQDISTFHGNSGVVH